MLGEGKTEVCNKQKGIILQKEISHNHQSSGGDLSLGSNGSRGWDYSLVMHTSCFLSKPNPYVMTQNTDSGATGAPYIFSQCSHIE